MSDQSAEVRAGERPIRVLHVITRLILGGAQENTLLTVIGQQKNPRYRVTLVAGIDDGPEGNLHDLASAAGVDLVLVRNLVRPIRPWTDFVGLVELYRLMRRGRYDIVHTHSSKAGILGRIAARLAGIPIVVHTLHSLVFHEYQKAWQNALYIRMKRFCAPLTDAFISVNDKTMQGALAVGVGTPDRHVKIFSGMELAPFLDVRDRLSTAEAKQRLGIPADAPVVGKIARLFPLKGHDQFLAAAEEIAKLQPDTWFLLVGDGILRQELEQRAREIGIADRTVFAGLVPRDKVAEHIQAMDVVVHTSLREGLARVLPQAGAVGKPVVTFELDGAPEVIRNGQTGYLVPPMDTSRLAERVVSLFRDPSLSARLGEGGRKFARENFDADQMVSQINAVYENLLASPARRGMKPVSVGVASTTT